MPYLINQNFMYKIITTTILSIFFLAGCASVSEIKTDEPQQKAQVAELKYKLSQPESDTASYLTFHSDNTFTLDFNMCDRIAQGTGKYSVDKDKYSLKVEQCSSCNGKNNGIKYDYGLPSVSLELKKISETELKIQNEVARTENGKQYGFCAPSNDPENKYDGIDYNLFTLVQK